MRTAGSALLVLAIFAAPPTLLLTGALEVEWIGVPVLVACWALVVLIPAWAWWTTMRD